MDSGYFESIESKIPRGEFRTRFAPSPTGFMHLGGLRTALYAYLLAKKEGGKLILRIEDTDRERRVEGAAELIYETLAACGIAYEEGPNVGGPVGPYVQSERREIYGAYARRLVENGHAYYCFCDKEVLDEQRLIHEASRVPHRYDRRCAALSEAEIAEKIAAKTPFVIRQKVEQNGKTVFNDAVYGRIEVENSTLEDQVILKSDGMPTYNFANVVDDRLMGVTHIIRGNEFLSSTPKHVLLYEGFGWDTPKYIHVPQIMRNATKKLSKRDGDAYFGDFIAKGYLKEAILNYIALLGWSPGGEEEKFSLAELTDAFNIEGISKSPAIFDYQKLNWLNGAYLRAMSDEEYHAAASPHIKQTVRGDCDTRYVASLLQGRVELLSEIPAQVDFIDAVLPHELDLYENKKMKTDAAGAKKVLPEVLAVLGEISAWDKDTIHGEISGLVARLGLKNGQVLWPMRVALSGKTFTPGGSIEICLILGKNETLARLAAAIERLGAPSAQ
ncbi:MAG: glutamate--tRNA ligase [Defluviitaleaceae bacterium]|nr:glutamate--tRNA ligase [Defluviitaleaceae bacterium]